MNKETIEKLESYLSNVTNMGTFIHITDVETVIGAGAEKVDYTYQANFTHPQLSNEMLYIGHFLELPFCLDLSCPGAVHVLTGNRTGLVDEWDWYGSFGEALGKVEEERNDR